MKKSFIFWEMGIFMKQNKFILQKFGCIFLSNIKFFFIFFLLFSLAWCTEEYWNYHSKEISLPQKNQIKQQRLFDVTKITEEKVEILQTPNKLILDRIIKELDLAKEQIQIETYIFTEKRILKALLEAQKRWVKIKIILEKNVYWAWNINKETFETLKNSWIEVQFADDKNYNFTHSKFIIIDKKYIIWTGNLSYASFVNNKEFFVFWDNERILTLLKQIIEKDYKKEKYIICDNTLVISPNCPREQFIKTLKLAKKEILIFAQTFDDDEIINILKNKLKEKVNIKILLWDIKKIKSNISFYDEMKKNWAQILSPTKPYIHAKSFLVDWELLYIGSINFSTNSINNNREVWLIFKNKDLTKKFKTEFEALFQKLQ